MLLRFHKNFTKMLKRSKKYLFYVVCTTFSLSYLITSYCVYYFEDEAPLPDVWYNVVNYFKSDDISCYNYETKNDFLIYITEKALIHNRIYFHETSCGRNLGLKQACAIESAARAHPNRQIQVLFTKPLAEKEFYRGPLSELYKLPNVDFSRIDLHTYALKTPLEKVFKDSLFSYGKRHYRRLAEYLKFITLFKFGGMVVDTDMMVVVPADYLGRSWLVQADSGKFGSAVMSMAKDRAGKNLSLWFLSALRNQATLDEIDGGKALHEVMSFVCNTSDVNEMTKEKCGVQIYSHEIFYPINQTSWRDYFKAGSLDDPSYGYHIWNSENYRLAAPTYSLYAKLARRYCPGVFHRFLYAFVHY